jgi:hypothetical protein
MRKESLESERSNQKKIKRRNDKRDRINQSGVSNSISSRVSNFSKVSKLDSHKFYVEDSFDTSMGEKLISDDLHDDLAINIRLNKAKWDKNLSVEPTPKYSRQSTNKHATGYASLIHIDSSGLNLKTEMENFK